MHNSWKPCIQKVLGGGGYGVTYSAIEQPTGKVVVIKTLNHIQQSKEDFQQRRAFWFFGTKAHSSKYGWNQRLR
ncbi:hypothetical protein [Nostoc sp.]|uniref:hypothetical protein n=1 Tax=Nostoc sp. TaxID=1180 RepID=UPI002FF26E53